MVRNHKEFAIVFWFIHVFLVLLHFSALNKPQLLQSVPEDYTGGFAVCWEELHAPAVPLAEE